MKTYELNLVMLSPAMLDKLRTAYAARSPVTIRCRSTSGELQNMALTSLTDTTATFTRIEVP